MNAEELIDRAVEQLEASPAIDHWQRDRERIEAEELLTHLVGQDWEPADDIPAPVVRRFRGLIDRRATGEPVPYIKGYAEFRGLRLVARPGVFVPRDSSEVLAEQAVRRLRGRRHPVAVDLATGSGPAARAISLARANARRLGLTVAFLRGDLFGALPVRLAGAVDVLSLHPPYVGKLELRDLPREILGFEPVDSLTDHSPRGLGLIERAAAESPAWLKPGGWLLIEVSPDRSRTVAALLRRAGYSDVRSTKGGLAVTRVITARA